MNQADIEYRANWDGIRVCFEESHHGVGKSSVQEVTTVLIYTASIGVETMLDSSRRRTMIKAEVRANPQQLQHGRGLVIGGNR